MTTEGKWHPVEVSLLLDDYRVQFQQDGAGIVARILAPSGEVLAWDRLSPKELAWLGQVIR